jgi:hypothetical protein
MTRLIPQLPENWREQLTKARAAGLPDSPQHQRARRNYIRLCFGDYEHSTDPDVLDELEAWWVLTVLPKDGMWQYWLTARV